jgi:hypothetical protein
MDDFIWTMDVFTFKCDIVHVKSSIVHVCGPTWARTRDLLIMSQLL